jgi:hypothetical protein
MSQGSSLGLIAGEFYDRVRTGVTVNPDDESRLARRYPDGRELLAAIAWPSRCGTCGFQVCRPKRRFQSACYVAATYLCRSSPEKADGSACRQHVNKSVQLSIVALHAVGRLAFGPKLTFGPRAYR